MREDGAVGNGGAQPCGREACSCGVECVNCGLCVHGCCTRVSSWRRRGLMNRCCDGCIADDVDEQTVASRIAASVVPVTESGEACMRQFKEID